MTLLDGIYSTIVIRDILERERRRGCRQLTDPVLLRKIIMFLADNIGNSTSVTSIGNTHIADIGLRNYLLGFRDMDTGHIIENIVYFELLRQGYDVAIGKVGNREG